MDMYSGKGYNEFAISQVFETSSTRTETHIVMSARLFNDCNPLHVNAAFTAKSRFGGRVAHGFRISNVMAAPLGMVFNGTANTYVGHHIRYSHPVRAGDTLAVKWTVTALEEKPNLEGGLVTLNGSCCNQDGIEAANAEARVLIQNV